MRVSGAVNIAQTILEKIDRSDIFVADVSIVGRIDAPRKTGKKRRRTPNPNVLFELGYALKCLGETRILLVMNTAYGTPEDLPFDLQLKRVSCYTSKEDDENKSLARKSLEKQVDSAISMILSELKAAEESDQLSSEKNVVEETILAIENNEAKRIPLIKKYIHWLLSGLESINQDYVSSRNHEDAITEAIAQSEQLVLTFARIADSTSTMSALDVSKRIYIELFQILERYTLRSTVSHTRRETDFDFYKFIGQELFVILFAVLIRDGNWKIIKELLLEKIYISNLTGGAGFVSIAYIPQTLRTLQNKKERLKLRRFSLHADELAKRYKESEIGRVIPFDQFMDADLFLFLYFEFNKSEEHPYYSWIPISNVYNYQKPPKFLHEAESVSKVEVIGEALLVNKNQFIDKLKLAQNRLKNIFASSKEIAPLAFYNADDLGSW